MTIGPDGYGTSTILFLLSLFPPLRNNLLQLMYYRGDVESTILNLFMECIASGCRLILIDDVDVLVPEVNASSSASDLYSSSALIHGIDTMAQRYNTESHRSEDRKIFIFATCTYHREIRQSLLVPHRLGDVSKILYLPFPSQKLRCSLILSLLTCTGIDIIWDIHTEGTKDTVTGGSAMRSMDERGDGGADLVRDDGTGRGSIIPKARGTHKEERIHGSPVLTNSTNLFKTGRRLSGHFPDIIAAADHLGSNRAFDLALALSHSTQVRDLRDVFTVFILIDFILVGEPMTTVAWSAINIKFFRLLYFPVFSCLTFFSVCASLLSSQIISFLTISQLISSHLISS